MSQKPLPRALQKRFNVRTADEMWAKYLSEGNLRLAQRRHFFGAFPSNPRCVQCNRSFRGIGHYLFRASESEKNPRFCKGCYGFTSAAPGGAEIELTMLFVDVRGSTPLAESMNNTDFSRLMNRFYKAAIKVLIQADAFIDKLVGDEVTALFIPGFAGTDHAQKAVRAGQELLRVTGHGSRSGPWVPVGVGVHTGVAWVGSIIGASGETADFTALGDNVNIAARLASNAGAGEALISDAALEAAGVHAGAFEKRALSLKGKSEVINVRVLKAPGAR